MKQYWVYILASRSRRLYVGVTSDLSRRLAEHRSGKGSAFTARYSIDCLVYFEEHPQIGDAIAREKKLQLVEQTNAGWLDLAPTA